MNTGHEDRSTSSASVQHDHECIGDDKHAEKLASENVGDPVGDAKFGELDKEEFPEGGRGWLVLAGSCVALVMSFGLVNSFGQYQLYYKQQFPDANVSVISLIGSVEPALMYAVSFAVVGLINNFGVQYTVLIGSIIMVFALMMISICKEVWQFFLAQGVVFSVGAGVTFFTGTALPSEWFKKRRAVALGISIAGSSVGGIIWPIALQQLIKKVGFPWANRIIGFIYIPITAFCTLAVKTRIPKNKKERILPNWSVCRNWRFVLLCLANTVGLMGFFPPLFHITTFASQLDVRPSIVNYVLTIVNAMTLLGRILPTLLADKIGRLNVLIPCSFITAALQYGLWLPARTETMVILFAVLYGAISGSYIALVLPLIGQLFGIEGNKSRISVCFLIAAPGCLAGPVIAGAFVPAGKETDLSAYSRAAAYSGSMMMFACFLFLVLRLSYSRKLMVFM